VGLIREVTAMLGFLTIFAGEASAEVFESVEAENCHIGDESYVLIAMWSLPGSSAARWPSLGVR
jgi:hypothetical protein